MLSRGQVHEYQDVSAFVADTRNPYDTDRSWQGGMNAAEAVRASTYGDNAAVAGAERFIGTLESKLSLPETVGLETVRSPYGGRVSMGDWMHGSPTPMRRRVRRNTEIGPVKIVVGSFVSAGIGANELKRRGEAIIAFLMLVQRFRPVDLYVLGESTHTGRDGWRYYYIRLESRPISLSQVGFVLGHPAFFRCVGNGWFIEKNPTAPGVPNLYDSIPETRERLGMQSQDVLIQKAVLGDELISNPTAWIQREMDRIVT